MKQVELTLLLDGLIATWENEVAEFKQANHNFSTDDIGTRYSCLQNESACRSHISAYKSITYSFLQAGFAEALQKGTLAGTP